MTKAEAIKILTEAGFGINIWNTPTGYCEEDWDEAFGMAIEALKETDMGLNNGDHLHPFGEPFGWTEEEIQKHGLRELLKAVDNKNDELSCLEEPNRSDVIKRQDAIDAIVAWTVEDRPDVEMPTDLIGRITDLPSAQPDLDGTLMMTVPQGMLENVKRVLVDEFGTKNCKVMYQDEPERKKGKWIPTKIAKPPKAGQYLVTKQQKTGACQIATAHYNPSFDEWSGNGNFKKILAWQPLPSPYTQE